MTYDANQVLDSAQKYFEAGQLDHAADLLHGVLSNLPEHGEALEGLGYIAARQGDHPRAADFLVRASRQLAMSVERLNVAAQICQLAHRHADAVVLFERCLSQFPDDPSSLHGSAMSLIKLGEQQRALALLERLCKSQPLSAEAHYNRGSLLGAIERYDDEIDAYRHAIRLKPNFVQAYVNLGVALRDVQRFEEALLQFKKALSLDSNDVGARTNRAQTNLLRGEFEHGWREYEWRWLEGPGNHGFPDSTLWKGTQPLNGKTVLVHNEQGYGDTLQFVRFVDRLSARGARVVLRVQDVLLPLLHDYAGADQVIGESAVLPPFDYHVPTMSLPFMLKLREADLAMAAPYLHADAALAADWDDLFAGPIRRPRIGVVWSGSRTHKNDRNRSISLEQIQPLFEADADFIALQNDIRETDCACFAQLVQRGVLRDVSARLTTFAATAALIERLDLVISVDTAVAHLAGALGKPAWIALPYTPDWRWQLNRSDSPWYPGTRLFRQAKRNDWSDAIASLREELTKRTFPPH
ncbi:tetratricopeptide repeat protein [Paraburkholderia sp. BL21I4N1]|uniref:tetratricopeptide repeat protein n=1 Tax=Paraburkholderia sp. BL21I4N1 TaxID=1938801 RepID=UPI000CFC066B|nr:tetratricopeptide repeat protein [Paraburkholderia sp. BL21I4N1]PQV52987.1 Flp pilus assembly protein TadD [Paraburkholderia sp. BL21I4N1]